MNLFRSRRRFRRLYSQPQLDAIAKETAEREIKVRELVDELRSAHTERLNDYFREAMK